MDTHNGLYIGESIRITLWDDPRHPSLKAKVSIVLNDAFLIRNIRILRLGDRIIVAFPSRQLEDGRYVDVAHPISTSVRDWAEVQILDAYSREMTIRIERLDELKTAG